MRHKVNGPLYHWLQNSLLMNDTTTSRCSSLEIIKRIQYPTVKYGTDGACSLDHATRLKSSRSGQKKINAKLHLDIIGDQVSISDTPHL